MSKHTYIVTVTANGQAPLLRQVNSETRLTNRKLIDLVEPTVAVEGDVTPIYYVKDMVNVRIIDAEPENPNTPECPPC